MDNNTLPATEENAPPIPVDEDNDDDMEPTDDDNPINATEAKHPLEDRFIAMFPFTPRRYIKERLAKIKNNPAAVARFTDELLKDPIPKGDWQDDEDAEEADEEVNEWKHLKLTELKILFL